MNEVNGKKVDLRCVGVEGMCPSPADDDGHKPFIIVLRNLRESLIDSSRSLNYVMVLAFSDLRPVCPFVSDPNFRNGCRKGWRHCPAYPKAEQKAHKKKLVKIAECVLRSPTARVNAPEVKVEFISLGGVGSVDKVLKKAKKSLKKRGISIGITIGMHHGSCCVKCYGFFEPNLYKSRISARVWLLGYQLVKKGLLVSNTFYKVMADDEQVAFVRHCNDLKNHESLADCVVEANFDHKNLAKNDKLIAKGLWGASLIYPTSQWKTKGTAFVEGVKANRDKHILALVARIEKEFPLDPESGKHVRPDKLRTYDERFSNCFNQCQRTALECYVTKTSGIKAGRIYMDERRHKILDDVVDLRHKWEKTFDDIIQEGIRSEEKEIRMPWVRTRLSQRHAQWVMKQRTIGNDFKDASFT